MHSRESYEEYNHDSKSEKSFLEIGDDHHEESREEHLKNSLIYHIARDRRDYDCKKKRLQDCIFIQIRIVMMMPNIASMRGISLTYSEKLSRKFPSRFWRDLIRGYSRVSRESERGITFAY
jgi:hypothetical protein